MSAPWTYPLGARPLSKDFLSGTILVQPGTTVLATLYPGAPQDGMMAGEFRVRPGREPRIVGYGQAWDAAGNSFLTHTLIVNGAPLPNFETLPYATAAPYSDTLYLPTPIIIPQLSRVAVRVTLAAGAGVAVNFTVAVMILNFDRGSLVGTAGGD